MIRFVIENKKMFFYVLFFFLIFFVTLGYLVFFNPVFCDEISNYGFSYNISQGMIPYRDFNVMQTPLYFFIGSIFIKIFAKYLTSLCILDAVLVTIMMYLLFKIMKKKAFLMYPFIVYYAIPSYNFFCLLWIILIFYLIKSKKDNDVLMGFIIGLLFLTKQSVGVCLFIPAIYYSKNKLKFLFSFSIPIFVLLIYLVYYGALCEFINYSFLGLFDFNDKNKYFSPFICCEIVILLYLFFLLLNSKLKDKDLFYILMFQIMAYPICDEYHFFVSLVPVIYYLIINNHALKFVFIFFVVICWSIFFRFFSNDSHLYLNNNFLQFRNVNKYFDDLEIKSKFIFKYKIEDIEHKFLIDGNAYFMRLYLNESIGTYDFMLNGNIGYEGSNKLINGIKNTCSSNSCIFFVDKYLFYGRYQQFNKDIYDYVINTYTKVDESKFFDIYRNVGGINEEK